MKNNFPSLFSFLFLPFSFSAFFCFLFFFIYSAFLFSHFPAFLLNAEREISQYNLSSPAKRESREFEKNVSAFKGGLPAVSVVSAVVHIGLLSALFRSCQRTAALINTRIVGSAPSVRKTLCLQTFTLHTYINSTAIFHCVSKRLLLPCRGYCHFDDCDFIGLLLLCPAIAGGLLPYRYC